jgi:hypothetical protein
MKALRLFVVCILLVVVVVLVRFTLNLDAPSISMAWDPNSEPNLAGYNVYRSQESGVFTKPPLNGSELVTATTFTDSMIERGQTYYYVVRAVGTEKQESEPSNQIQVTIARAGDITAPAVSMSVIGMPLK